MSDEEQGPIYTLFNTALLALWRGPGESNCFSPFFKNGRDYFTMVKTYKSEHITTN